MVRILLKENAILMDGNFCNYFWSKFNSNKFINNVLDLFLVLTEEEENKIDKEGNIHIPRTS